MTFNDIDANLTRALKHEKATEMRNTRVAASLGLPIGLALSVGLPVAAVSQGALAPGLIELLVAAVVAPPFIGAAQQSMRNRGWLLVSEFLGYFGCGLGVVGGFCRVPGARTPLSFLAEQYENCGRYQLAHRFYALANHKPQERNRNLIYLELMEQAERLHLLFNSAKYDECAQLGETLLLSSSRTYYDEPSEINHLALCSVQAVLVTQFYATGQCEKARAIWATIKAMPEFSDDADKAMIANCYNRMSQAAITVEDFYAALRYAKLARDCFERAELTCKLLAGEIALNMAHAYLRLGYLRDAEIEAADSLLEWRAVLSPYAAKMSHAYYVLAMIQQQREDLYKSVENFKRARTILRERTGATCLQLLPILVALRSALHQLNRSEEANTIDGELSATCKMHKCKPAECAGTRTNPMSTSTHG